MGAGRGSFMIYSIDADTNQHYIIATYDDVSNQGSTVYQTRFGFGFCRMGYSGTACEPNCPNSQSFCTPRSHSRCRLDREERNHLLEQRHLQRPEVRVHGRVRI